MAPKAATKTRQVLPQEPEPELPQDLPSECPFALHWNACLASILTSEGLDTSGISSGLCSQDVVKVVNLQDQVARLEQNDPLAQEIRSAEDASAASGGSSDPFSLPPSLAIRVLQLKFDRDRSLAWKLELVRRRGELSKQEEVAKSEAAALCLVRESLSAAEATLQGVEAQVEQQTGIPRSQWSSEEEAVGESTSEVECGVLPSAPAKRWAEARAAVKLAQDAVHQSEVKLKEAEVGCHACREQMSTPFYHCQLYWVEGLPITYDKFKALLDEGLPLYCVAWLHHANTVPGSVPPPPPALFAALMQSEAEAPWPDLLSQLAVVEVPVGQGAGLFSQPEVPPVPITTTETSTKADKTGKGKESSSGQASSGKAGTDGKSNRPKSGKSGRNAIASKLQETAGLYEAAQLMAALRSCRERYQQWEKEATIYKLNKPSPVDLSYYHHLMDEVPEESAGVPLILDCLLEQVCCNLDTSSEVAVPSEEDHHLSEAHEVIQRALEVFEKAEQQLLWPCEESPVQCTVLKEGDQVGARAAGLHTGYTPIPGSLQGVKGGRCGSPLAVGDVEHVERHMLDLVSAVPGDPWPIKDANFDLERSIKMRGLKAHCQDLPWSSYQRSQLLDSFLQSLPPAVNAAHGNEIRTRRHHEKLDENVVKQVLSSSSLSYPDQIVAYYADEDACLVTLCGANHTYEESSPTAVLLTFREFFQAFVEGGGVQPELDSKVYCAPRALAKNTHRKKVMYSKDGSVVTYSPLLPLSIAKEEVVSGLRLAGTPTYLTTLPGGTTVAAYMRSSYPTGQETSPSGHEKDECMPVLQCCPPNGVHVELNAEGQWLLAPQENQQEQVLSFSSLDVLECPVGGVDLSPVMLPPLEWLSVLPDGAVLRRMVGGAIRITHRDGTVSEYRPAKGGDAAAWIRTLPDGSRWLEPCEPAPAPPPPPEAPPAEATLPPERPASSKRKEDKVSKIKPKKAVTKGPTRDSLAHDLTPVTEDKEGPPLADPQAPSPAPPPPPAKGPEALPPLQIVEVIDPDTGAKVTTREDLMMTIAYPDGSVLVLDNDGIQFQHNGDNWCVEANGLPPILGGPSKVVVLPAPGVTLTWDKARATMSASIEGGGEWALNKAGILACTPTKLEEDDLGRFSDMTKDFEKNAGNSTVGANESYSKDEEGVTTSSLPPPGADPMETGPSPPAVPLASKDPLQTSNMGNSKVKVMLTACSTYLFDQLVDLTTGEAVFCDHQDVTAGVGPGGSLVVWSQEPHGETSPSNTEDPGKATERAQAADGGASKSTSQAGGGPDPFVHENEPGILPTEVPQTSPPGPNVVPIAVSLSPRLFVVYRDGSGMEILSKERFKGWHALKDKDPDCTVEVHMLTGSSEPGTRCYSYLTRHQLKSAELAHLPSAPMVTAQPYQHHSAEVLPALKRSSTYPLGPVSLTDSLGSRYLPRIAAVMPSVPQSLPPVPVLVSREIMEYPEVTEEVRTKAVETLERWKAHEEERKSRMADLKEAIAEVEREQSLEDPEVATQIVQLGLRGDIDRALQEASQKKMAPNSEGTRSSGQTPPAGDEAGIGGGDKGVKAKRPWPQKKGPFDDTSKRPQPGQVLRYFDTEEGLIAKQEDPLLSTEVVPAVQPATFPRRPVPAASPGRQAKPGIYLSHTTTLLADDAPGSQPDVEQAISPLNQARPEVMTRACDKLPKSPKRTAARQPQVTRSQEPGSLSPSRVPNYHPPDLGYSTMVQSPQTLQSTIRSCDYDVYGQPRLRPPVLPPTYTQDEAAVIPNDRHIVAEGEVLRCTKTSSTSLLQIHGKVKKQFQVTPSHIHFGTVPQGAVVHRQVKLLNVSTERARFTAVRPPPPLRWIYNPGPLAAGMDRSLTVEFTAGGPGDFVGELEIRSELNVIHLTCSAKVVPGGSKTTTREDVRDELGVATSSPSSSQGGEANDLNGQ